MTETATASAANRSRAGFTLPLVAAFVVAGLVVGVGLGFVVSRSRASSNQALATARHRQIDQLRRERDDLAHARPPESRTTTSTTVTTEPTTSSSVGTSVEDPGTARQQLANLAIRPNAVVPGYDRGLFGGWVDSDHDCENTRAEVLIAESRTPTAGRCTIAAGTWTDPYTGKKITEAHQLDIDHTVPLSNAWSSGAWAWQPSQRIAFANVLEDPASLIAVSASANRAKGDRSPDQWRPPNQQFWCAYAVDWVEIKTRWTLSVTSPEQHALENMLERC